MGGWVGVWGGCGCLGSACSAAWVWMSGCACVDVHVSAGSVVYTWMVV